MPAAVQVGGYDWCGQRFNLRLSISSPVRQQHRDASMRPGLWGGADGDCCDSYAVVYGLLSKVCLMWNVDWSLLALLGVGVCQLSFYRALLGFWFVVFVFYLVGF